MGNGKYLNYAIAATEFVEEIDYLKSLIKRDYPIPVLYQFLSLAIVYLEIVEKQDLSFLYESFESGDLSCVIGGCAAIYMSEMVLEDDNFNRIMSYVTQPKYLEHIGKVTNPFLFILAASYLFSKENRKKILIFSEQFYVQIVRDIISDVKKGKDGKRINFF